MSTVAGTRLAMTHEGVPAHHAAPSVTEDLSLPKIAYQHVRALNAFYRARPALETAIAGRAATIAASWPLKNEFSDRYVIGLRLDNDDGELSVPRSILDVVFADLDPELSLDRLAAENAGIVLEYAMSRILEAVEAKLGCRLSVTAVHGDHARPARAMGPALAFELVVEGIGNLGCELRVATRHAVKLAEHLDHQATMRRAVSEIPIGVSLRVAAATLTIEEVVELSPGDVVLADEACSANGTAVAVIGRYFVAPVELTSEWARITARVARGHNSPWEWSMDDANDSFAGTNSQVSDLDDLPIRIVFELGRVELTLGEIQALAPGALLQLARPLEEALDIVANGKRIGRGTLVKIGDSVGVRVARLFDDA
jgi:type III secretion protein Q